MKKQFSKHIASYVLIASLLLPIGISFVHMLHNHEHNTCSAKHEQHIHKQNANCSSFHYLSPVQAGYQHFEYKLFPTLEIFKIPTLEHLIYFSHKLTYFLVRGPPNVNVF